MRHFLLAILFFLSLNASADQGPRHLQLKEPNIDWDIVERIWQYVKIELNAPDVLGSIPLVLDWNVPGRGQMAYTFPTAEFPRQPHQISISPRIVETGSREIVIWGIGHELTHYVMLMKENNWNTSQLIFVNNRRHHCDKEFMRITRGIADIIYSVLHDIAKREEMYQEVLKACRLTPEQ